MFRLVKLPARWIASSVSAAGSVRRILLRRKRGEDMQAYGIRYHIRGTQKVYDINIDAKDVKSAKRKIGRLHGYQDGRMIVFEDCKVIGYF